MPATPLDKIIREIIATDGPMPVDRYFALVLGHPQHGYYMAQQPFGLEGDFITAPEASQMFGELIGVWFASIYQSLGSPKLINLVEVGPGQGVLMADMLRAAKVMPGFRDAVRVHFVETSRRLREIQKEAVGAQGFTASWYDNFSDVPAGPMLLAGNEFFDAIPIKQFESRGGAWHERYVGLTDKGELGFVLNPAETPLSLIPDWAQGSADESIAEVAPVRSAIATEMARRLARDNGAAIFIDYGHAESGVVDTLQAMRAHKYADVFEEIGFCDLTSHVDFGELGRAMAQGGAKVLPVLTQGEFLRAMGIDARAQQLLRNATDEQRDAIEFNHHRLIADDQMGTLFKVMAAVSPGMAAPYPFAEP